MAQEHLASDLSIYRAHLGGERERSSPDLRAVPGHTVPPHRVPERDLASVDRLDNLRQALVNRLLTRRGELAALGHVQPTAVLRRIVELQLPGQPTGFLRRKGLVQNRWCMGVEVVQHHPNHLRLRKDFIHQPFYLLGQVLPRPPLRHVDFPPAPQGLEDQKQIAAPPPLIFVVHPLWLPRFHRQGLLDIGQQRIRPFVKADDRSSWVVRFGVQVQHILHAPEEVRRDLSDAPLLLLPGLEIALGHPEYGSRLYELIGQPNSATRRNLAKLFVLEALAQEPRVDSQQIQIDVQPDPRDRTRVLIEIRVRPVGEVSSLSLQVPFSFAR
jgi:phage baseplate assembly protein W